jgi:hypothetical protein
MKETMEAIRKRHISRARARRGSQESGRNISIELHRHHHPVSPHHGEPVLRDLEWKNAARAEKTVFEPRIAEEPLMAKANVVNNIVATAQAGIDNGFRFTEFPSPSRKPEDPTLYQLTPVLDAVGHHFALVGTLANERATDKDIKIKSASLMAVQVKPDGVHPIETLLAVDFGTESFLGNRNQEADLRLLHLTGSVLQMMHDQLVAAKPQS